MKLKKQESKRKKAVAAQQKAEARAALNGPRLVRDAWSPLRALLQASKVELESKLQDQESEQQKMEARMVLNYF